MCLTLCQPNTGYDVEDEEWGDDCTHEVMLLVLQWCWSLFWWPAVREYIYERQSICIFGGGSCRFFTFWINKKIAHYHHMIKTPILIIVTITTVDDEDDDDDDDVDGDDDDLSRKNSWRQSIRGCARVFLLLLVFVWSFVRRFLFVSFRFFSLTELDGIENCFVMCNIIEPLFSLLLLMPFWGRRCVFGRWDDVHQALGRLDHFTDHRVMFVFVVLLQFVFVCVFFS